MNVKTTARIASLTRSSVFAATILLAALPAISEEAKAAPDYGASMQDYTADGTWDCEDNAGANFGVVVIADETYAFLKPDGILGGYGKLWSLDDGPRVPTFVVVDGYLKGDLGVQGASIGGPRDDDQNYAGQLFLRLLISEENKIDCVRRESPGT